MPLRSPTSNLHFALQDIIGKSRTTGNTFFVDSGDTSSSDVDGRSGRDPGNPVATIDFAVSLCTADNGDLIIAMPGHAEVVSAAAGLDLDQAGITLVGLGRGSSQPTVTLGTATSATVVIGAANVTIENIHFVAALQDIVACIDVDGDDFTCRGCRFSDGSSSLNFLVCILDGLTGVSDRITVEDCTSFGLDPSNTHFINLTGTGIGHIIRRNVLQGDWGTTCIGGAGIVTLCTIVDNYIHNTATDSAACINMGATATGICANNMCSGGHATAGLVVGDLGAVENYYMISTSDSSGLLNPAVA